MVDAVNQLQNDLFLLTPLREGRPSVTRQAIRVKENFYSRPCGRGDDFVVTTKQKGAISTHAPAGGATFNNGRQFDSDGKFLLTPLREGRLGGGGNYQLQAKFLLTPLREGRLRKPQTKSLQSYFYSRPCGRGDLILRDVFAYVVNFYSRPCGRGDSNFPQVRHEVLRQIAER